MYIWQVGLLTVTLPDLTASLFICNQRHLVSGAIRPDIGCWAGYGFDLNHSSLTFFISTILSPSFTTWPDLISHHIFALAHWFKNKNEIHLINTCSTYNWVWGLYGEHTVIHVDFKSEKLYICSLGVVGPGVVFSCRIVFVSSSCTWSCVFSGRHCSIEYRHHRWRGHRWRGHRWRGHRWRDHRWRGHRCRIYSRSVHYLRWLWNWCCDNSASDYYKVWWEWEKKKILMHCIFFT